MSGLPFDKLAVVERKGGEVLGEAAVAIWPAGDRENARGQAYDWTGEADPASAPLLVRRSNRQLRVEVPLPGEDPSTTREALFTVVSAVFNEFVPHVELRLLEQRGG